MLYEFFMVYVMKVLRISLLYIFFILAELGAKEMVILKFEFAEKYIHSFCGVSLPLITPSKKENRFLYQGVTFAEFDLVRLVIQIQFVTPHFTYMLSFAQF